MITDQKNSCTSELGAEILLVITSFIIVISVLIRFFSVNAPITPITPTGDTIYISDEDTNFFLSLAYAIFLPLLSYLFSQNNQNNQDGRAQVILIWMVLIEIIRIHSDPIFTWRLRKSAEQFVRLFWVGFLVCSYTPLHGIRVSLLVLCIYLGICEVLKGIIFKKSKDSCLIGKNPQIIHNYVERKMFQDDLHTTPMKECDYIVMGEENHKIDLCSNGYVLGKKKSSSDGILTIGRVFQLNSSEGEVLTSAKPYWRDTCLSFALAKMLRLRFAKLPVDEAGGQKSLEFVQGIIDHVGSNQDIQTDENDGERNPTKGVFSIIQEELKYVSDFLNIKVPASHYLEEYTWVFSVGLYMMLGNGIYLIYTVSKSSSAWLSLAVEKEYNHCFFHAFQSGSVVVKIFSRLDQAITILLFVASLYIHFTGSVLLPFLVRAIVFRDNSRWSILGYIGMYIRDPTKWNTSHSSSAASKSTKGPSRLAKSMKEILSKAVRDQNVNQARDYYPSIVDLEAETIFFCIKVDVSTLARLPKWIRRIIPRSSPRVIFSSTDAKEVILRSLREKSDGRLTNGESSLKKHKMDQLNWACQVHASTTETILVWHIATTLFHNHKTSAHHNSDPYQEPTPKQNNNLFKKKQEVALVLSNYCHYLVKYLPDLLPDKVDWTEKIYERVQKEILDIHIPLFFDQKHTTKYRCNYALEARWLESSVVGKGARLANELMKCAEDEAQVWTMLADFWAEMMLFIAPSDNVDGHEKLLDQDELITQLWALLTHAGIITRPKPTKHQNHEGESNV